MFIEVTGMDVSKPTNRYNKVLLKVESIDFVVEGEEWRSTTIFLTGPDNGRYIQVKESYEEIKKLMWAGK